MSISEALGNVVEEDRQYPIELKLINVDWKVRTSKGRSITLQTVGLLQSLNPNVLFLPFRSALRVVRTKPPANQPKFLLFVRYNFRTQAASASPRDVDAIEHLLRRGKRQFQTYADHSVKDCWVSQEMRDWERLNKLQRIPLATT